MWTRVVGYVLMLLTIVSFENDCLVNVFVILVNVCVNQGDARVGPSMRRIAAFVRQRRGHRREGDLARR